MNQNKILVIAFKYNDILYALGTSEFQAAQHKKLVIFFVDGRDPKDFPLQNVFEEVEYVRYLEGVKNIWKNLLAIKRMQWNCDVLMFSNPILLATKLITKLSKCQKVIWLEDGLMNYYPLSDIHYTSSRTIKRFIQLLLRIRDKDVYSNKKLVTYLLCPDMAVSYWGEIRKLTFDRNLIDGELLEKLSFIKGKKFFIGQPLYNTGRLGKKKYVDSVNKIINQYGIDYYVPHFASKDEDIKCAYFNLQDYHITFEFLACAFSFTLYSISSTLLYSTKMINPEVSTFMVCIDGMNNKKPILQKVVNGTVNC